MSLRNPTNQPQGKILSIYHQAVFCNQWKYRTSCYYLTLAWHILSVLVWTKLHNQEGLIPLRTRIHTFGSILNIPFPGRLQYFPWNSMSVENSSRNSPVVLLDAVTRQHHFELSGSIFLSLHCYDEFLEHSVRTICPGVCMLPRSFWSCRHTPDELCVLPSIVSVPILYHRTLEFLSLIHISEPTRPY